MNLSVTGQHFEVTPAIRQYLDDKFGRVSRHFDHVIDISVVLKVEKQRQHVEANIHVQGKDLFAETTHEDMYAAIDELIDMLDRQVLKHKEKLKDHRQTSIKHLNVES
jgi:putative sigma-54 modulation protein